MQNFQAVKEQLKHADNQGERKKNEEHLKHADNQGKNLKKNLLDAQPQRCLRNTKLHGACVCPAMSTSLKKHLNDSTLGNL